MTAIDQRRPHVASRIIRASLLPGDGRAVRGSIWSRLDRLCSRSTRAAESLAADGGGVGGLPAGRRRHRRLPADPPGRPASSAGEVALRRDRARAHPPAAPLGDRSSAAFYAPMAGAAAVVAAARHHLRRHASTVAAWIDAVCTFVVVTGFNVVLTFFVVSAYLDRLLRASCSRRAASIIASSTARFRRKVGSARALRLLRRHDPAGRRHRELRRRPADAARPRSTSSPRWSAAAIIYYWITRALTRPIDRLDYGMRQVAGNDLAVRLPVTSDDEVGHAASRLQPDGRGPGGARVPARHRSASM